MDLQRILINTKNRHNISKLHFVDVLVVLLII